MSIDLFMCVQTLRVSDSHDHGRREGIKMKASPPLSISSQYIAAIMAVMMPARVPRAVSVLIIIAVWLIQSPGSRPVFNNGFFAAAQQSYSDDFSEDCDNYHEVCSGYLCNSAAKECKTYALYRAQPLYMSLQNISALFNTEPALIASLSNLSAVKDYSKPLSLNQAVLIPIQCKCSGNFSQANLTYTVQHNDIYINIANQTLEGLTTCQAMIEQNPRYGINDLVTGIKLVAPLRCACPTAKQVAKGVKFLLSYIADPDDDDDIMTAKFNILHEDFISANNLKPVNPTIYPYTTLLIPLDHTPVIPPSGPFAPPPPPVIAKAPTFVYNPAAETHKSSSHISVPIIASMGGALLLGAGLVGAIFFARKRRSKTGMTNPKTKTKAKPADAEDFEIESSFLSNISELLASDRLIRFSFKELQEATDNFSGAHRIKGSVFHAVLRGERVAIKQMRGQVSKEINALHRFHHASLVTLLGICVEESSEQDSYLVFEYAENRSLSDWIHGARSRAGDSILTWNQRLQIALDVAEGLEYLHHSTTPSCVHKDLKSSNILLDKNFRAKIANFGLAKSGGIGGSQVHAVTSHIVGTHGYMAPEFIRDGLVTPKLDVFAFGVILLEILSGKQAVDVGSNFGGFRGGERVLLSEEIRFLIESENPKETLRDWVDPQIKGAGDGSYPVETGFKVARLAKLCVERDLTVRPSMREVRVELSRMAGGAGEAGGGNFYSYSSQESVDRNKHSSGSNSSEFQAR